MAGIVDDKTVKAVNGLVITVGVIGVLAVSGYLVYKGIKNAKAKKDSKREAQESTNELNNLIVQGIKPTLNSAQTTAIANSLFSAMDGYGTNYNIILKEFAKINNEVDLLSVAKAYGVRTVSSGNLNPEPNFTGTLQNTLKEECTTTQITALNGMLSRKGIKNRL